MMDFTILEKLTLESGSHSDFEEGVCVMEAAAYIAGEKFSDHPTCVSEVIGSFMRSWNDGLPDNEARDRLLKPLVSVIIGTKTTEADDIRRSQMAVDWMVRVYTPGWMDLLPTGKEIAAKLRALPELKTNADCRDAQPLLDEASKIASAARSAAWIAARSAAWIAARSAAWSAARSAAWIAAWSAACSAARSAAWSAAWIAARSAAWSAARSAAESALRETTEHLQASAQDLVRRMAAVCREHAHAQVPA